MAKTDGLPPRPPAASSPASAAWPSKPPAPRAVRRRRLGRGERHADVEDLLAGLSGTKHSSPSPCSTTQKAAATSCPASTRSARDAADTFMACQRRRPRAEFAGVRRRPRPQRREARALAAGSDMTAGRDSWMARAPAGARLTPEPPASGPARPPCWRARPSSRPWTSYWRARASALDSVPTSAQLICLREYLGRRGPCRPRPSRLDALSGACHHHPYELPPTAAELRQWIDTVSAFVRQGAA